jgi:hypothetical protein
MTRKATFKLIFLAAAGCVALAFSIGGCGDDDSRLTKAQFIQHADAICRRAAAAQAEIASRYKKGEVAPDNFEAVTAVFVPPMEKEVRKLSALHPPQADEETVRAILEGFESGVEDAKVDYLDLFLKEADPFAKANDLARTYGFRACAESSHAVIKPQG